MVGRGEIINEECGGDDLWFVVLYDRGGSGHSDLARLGYVSGRSKYFRTDCIMLIESASVIFKWDSQ